MFAAARSYFPGFNRGSIDEKVRHAITKLSDIKIDAYYKPDIDGEGIPFEKLLSDNKKWKCERLGLFDIQPVSQHATNSISKGILKTIYFFDCLI